MEMGGQKDIWRGRTRQKVEAKITSNFADNWELHFCAFYFPEISRLTVFATRPVSRRAADGHKSRYLNLWKWVDEGDIQRGRTGQQVEAKLTSNSTDN